MLWLATRRALCALALALLVAGCDSGGVTNGDGRIYPGGGFFGQAIALDGDRALVGANDSDEAFVLSRAGGEWQVDARLQPAGFPDRGSGGTDNNVLYGWDVGLDGDVAVVGAPIFAQGRAAEPARAFVYERRGGAWVEAAELRSPTPTPGAQLGIFGLPVAVSDGRVAVRMQNNSVPISGEVVDPAAVLIYERVEGAWTETARVEETVLSPEGRSLGFGDSMALDGDRLAVSSSSQDVGGMPRVGAVRVYERNGVGWPLSAVLTHPEPQQNDTFGRPLAISGPFVVASALGRRVINPGGEGAVVVFREVGGAWAFEAELRPDVLSSLDSFGFALDADSGPLGDRVAVSAAGRARSRGSVFVWVRRASGVWEFEAELWPEGLGAGSAFGEDVEIEGDRLLAGAIYDQGGRGGVYEFRLGPGGWTQVK